MLNAVNIVFCGVGGQGILLASDIVALAALMTGCDIKKSELHGMSQRGGSVISHVRFGAKIYSPLVSSGNADFLISFELLETMRWTEFTNSDTRVIVLANKIKPETVERYPCEIEEQIKKTFRNLDFIEPGKTAEIFSDNKSFNMLPLGVLSTYLELPDEYWEKAIGIRSPDKYYKENLSVFHAGRAFARERKLVLPVFHEKIVTPRQQEFAVNNQ